MTNTIDTLGGMAAGYKSHPGCMSADCPLRGIVTPAFGATSTPGFNCEYTGGHCLPDGECGQRRAELARLKQKYGE